MAVAVTNAYASPDEYRAGIDKTDTSSDQAIASDLQAISRYLDKRLGRFFTTDTADVARIYYPRVLPAYNRPVDWAESENPWLWGGFSRWLFIDDVVSVTSVIQDLNGDGLFTGDPPFGPLDFQLMPLNAQLGPEPAPYTSLFIPTWSSTAGGFVSGRAVQVTGRFGWPAVPAAIQRAAIQLTAIWRLESPRATSRVTELNQVVSTSKQAQTIVDQLLSVYYRKESLI